MRKSYLFVGKAQLVFEDRLSIGQALHLVGERVERVSQRLR